MTSPAKIRANRRNARKSTGPRTRAGKAIVACNALQHGLNIPAFCDPVLAPEVVELARDIETSVTGAEADATGHELACRIAEAVIDWRRVRLAKLSLAATLDADPGDRRALTQLWRLDRYEARALSRRKRAIREFDAVVLPMRLAKQSQRRKPNDSRQSAPSPLAQPHPEERSHSERVSKDGPHVRAAPHRPPQWFETRRPHPEPAEGRGAPRHEAGRRRSTGSNCKTNPTEKRQ
jgi:hypothetical protein